MQIKVHPAMRDSSFGNRDLEAGAVSLRIHGQRNLGARPRAEVVAEILQSIMQKSLTTHSHSIRCDSGRYNATRRANNQSSSVRCAERILDKRSRAG
jgi:hypothetical protein